MSNKTKAIKMTAIPVLRFLVMFVIFCILLAGATYWMFKFTVSYIVFWSLLLGYWWIVQPIMKAYKTNLEKLESESDQTPAK